MDKIVVSGINITSGGMLSVFKDCLNELVLYSDCSYEIIALVHRKELFAEFGDKIRFMEFPNSKKSWFLRCYYEYCYFYFLSREIKPLLWLSMHDMSPKVCATYQAVYCHNPSPFFSMELKEILVDFKITLFTFFYKYLYKINIRSNRYVIVQQRWLEKAFKELYGIQRVIVARPNMAFKSLDKRCEENHAFIYPTFPRMYKNIELICEAFKLLADLDIKVYITIDGTENTYARKAVAKYSQVKGVHFIGLQSREEIFANYNKVRGMIFPSRLESWGMPLSEFATTEKIILAADLNYAHETLAGYQRAKFFDVKNSAQLAEYLRKIVQYNEFIPDPTDDGREDSSLYAKDWQALFRYLLN